MTTQTTTGPKRITAPAVGQRQDRATNRDEVPRNWHRGLDPAIFYDRMTVGSITEGDLFLGLSGDAAQPEDER